MMAELKYIDKLDIPTESKKTRLLDFWNHTVVNSYVWGCPTSELSCRLNSLVSHNHLDIGVQCGYVLQELLPDSLLRLVIADDDMSNLSASSQRLAYYEPEKLHASLIGKLPDNIEKFDSISINYLLHRLMGRLDYKGEQILKNVNHLLNPGGVVFGSTIMGRGIKKSYLSKKAMRYCNDNLIFNNRYDSPSLLRMCLKKYFVDVKIEVVGSVAIFKASKPS